MNDSDLAAFTAPPEEEKALVDSEGLPASYLTNTITERADIIDDLYNDLKKTS